MPLNFEYPSPATTNAKNTLQTLLQIRPDVISMTIIRDNYTYHHCSSWLLSEVPLMLAVLSSFNIYISTRMCVKIELNSFFQ